MKEDSEADSGSEGSFSSKGADPWDNVEEEVMRAFDDKLDALCPAPLIAGTLAAPDLPPRGTAGCAASVVAEDTTIALAPLVSGTIAAPEQLHQCLAAPSVAKEEARPSLEEPCTTQQVLYSDSSTAFRELCKAEPYRPEDQVLTADEMWGGLSSDDEGAARVCSGTMPGSAVTQQAEQSADLTAPSTHHSSGDKSQRLADTGALLQQACQLEPYKPEDHILTAEEMWGTSDSDNEGGASAAETAGQHAEKQTGDSRDAGSSHVPLVWSASSNSGERLRRVLAGVEAPKVLAGLGFAELSAVAEDCERAVATLRWVLTKQHDMVAAMSGVERPGVPVG